MLGVIGVFFYVGIEIGIPGVLIFYLASVTGSAAVAGGVATIYWLLMLCGRMISSAISSKVSKPHTAYHCVNNSHRIHLHSNLPLRQLYHQRMPSYAANEGFSIVEVPQRHSSSCSADSAHR